MKATIVFLVMLQACLAFAETDNPYSKEDWLREGLAQQLPKFKRVILTPHPEKNGIVAANCETAPAWWGSLRVFHRTGDNIDWIANLPPAYSENCGHYILSCKWHYLKKIQIWILEVFDSTHMGNGSLWLFTLEGHDLRLLLHTVARGKFLQRPANLVVPVFGETRLVESHLKVNYRKPKGTDLEAVFLAGTIVALDGNGKKSSSKPFAESWRWDTDKRVFTRIRPKP